MIKKVRLEASKTKVHGELNRDLLAREIMGQNADPTGDSQFWGKFGKFKQKH